MRLWQNWLFFFSGSVAMAMLASQVAAVECESPRIEDKHRVEVSLDDRQSAEKTETVGTPANSATPIVAELIRQLGEPDFRQRESAVAKLKALGRTTLPALKQTRESTTDPEVASRADAVIHFFERPPLPSPGSLGRRGATVHFSNINGVNRIDVREPGRILRIEHGTDGIAMLVTGMEDGKEVTREFKAGGAEELRQQHPDAFELFQQWTTRTRGRRVGGADRGSALQPFRGRKAAIEDALRFLDEIDAEQRKHAREAEALHERVRKFEQEQFERANEPK